MCVYDKKYIFGVDPDSPTFLLIQIINQIKTFFRFDLSDKSSEKPVHLILTGQKSLLVGYSDCSVHEYLLYEKVTRIEIKFYRHYRFYVQRSYLMSLTSDYLFICSGHFLYFFSISAWTILNYIEFTKIESIKDIELCEIKNSHDLFDTVLKVAICGRGSTKSNRSLLEIQDLDLQSQKKNILSKKQKNNIVKKTKSDDQKYQMLSKSNKTLGTEKNRLKMSKNSRKIKITQKQKKRVSRPKDSIILNQIQKLMELQKQCECFKAQISELQVKYRQKILRFEELIKEKDQEILLLKKNTQNNTFNNFQEKTNTQNKSEAETNKNHIKSPQLQKFLDTITEVSDSISFTSFDSKSSRFLFNQVFLDHSVLVGSKMSDSSVQQSDSSEPFDLVISKWYFITDLQSKANTDRIVYSIEKSDTTKQKATDWKSENIKKVYQTRHKIQRSLVGIQKNAIKGQKSNKSIPEEYTKKFVTNQTPKPTNRKKVGIRIYMNVFLESFSLL